jgi:hypothetical protein
MLDNEGIFKAKRIDGICTPLSSPLLPFVRGHGACQRTYIMIKGEGNGLA